MSLLFFKFMLYLLTACIAGWIVFMFVARVAAFLLSHIMGATIDFGISGCNGFKDVTVKLKKGVIESIYVGEIKLSPHWSLLKLDPKLQLSICDLEIKTRSSEKKTVKRTKKPCSKSSGKLMVLANMARFLSVSVMDLTVRTPKESVRVKNMGLDLLKIGGTDPVFNFKLHIVPLLLDFLEPKICDQSTCFLHSQASSLNAEMNPIAFVCDDFSVECEFGHNKENGIEIRNLDVTSGDVTVNLKEDILLRKKSESSPGAHRSETVASEQTVAKKSNSVESLKKHMPMLPEKVSFNLPKLDLRFMHREQGFSVGNNITGICLRSSKSHFCEDTGQSTSHFDVQMDFSEIHLLREGSNSFLEIMKVAVITSIDVPMEPASSVRAEIDVKLGGTQCNIIPSRLAPMLCLQKPKKKKMVLHCREDSCHKDKPPKPEGKIIMWTSTASVPEINIVLHDVKGLPLYRGCSKSLHLSANNTSNEGMQVHGELGELHLYTADEHRGNLKENFFNSLVNIARISVEYAHKEIEEHGDKKWCLVSSVVVIGMGIHLNFHHIESLVTNAMSFKTLLPKQSAGKNEKPNKVGHSIKTPARKAQIFKLSVQQCSVIFSGDVCVEDMIVSDPKRVNFGSQGGEVIISLSSDGSPRQAHIKSMISNGNKDLKNSTGLDIFHLSLCVNKEKQFTRMEIKRAMSVYKEYSEKHGPINKVTLFDIKNAKFVRRLGGINENSICSLFSASDITAHWEPDSHLALYDVALRLKFLIHNLKLKSSSDQISEDMGQRNESVLDQVQHDKRQKKKDSIFAVDIEMLSVSAELADGVEALIQVQSIFSENARIGILLEGLILSVNKARILKSSRMQISRIPVFASNNSLDAKTPVATRWDWVIRSLDVHICMSYRLQLRAIDDAVEDTLRGLKLINSAKTNILFPVKDNKTKKGKSGSSNIGSVRFNIRKLSAEIEEEPIQGWLDEHYKLIKNQMCELNARLKFFDNLVSEGSKHSGIEKNEMSTEKKIQHEGVDIDMRDLLAIERLRDEIHKKAFQSYYLACQKLVHSEGSGAWASGVCVSDLQTGFKPSTARSSLLTLCATELDITLNRIEGDDIGMIEFINKIDPVSLDIGIPFSRLYGRNLVLHTESLVAQIRDYTFPLFSGAVGKCEGCIVLAQQATCFQPQMVQDIYVGSWRKVHMLRSLTGTTPPMKFYSNLPIYFQKGEVSFGVGYETVFADISYAFTVALRRANLSVWSSKLNIQNVIGSQNASTTPVDIQAPKKERSLPWWDDMRNYIHGNIKLCFDETMWNVLGTSDPYEKLEKIQIFSGYLDIHQTDGRVSASVKEFKAFISSLESLMSTFSLKPPVCVSEPFLYSPSFSLEVTMDWQCESGHPLNHYLFAVPNEGTSRTIVFDPFRSTSLSLKWNFSLRPGFHPSGELLDESIPVGSQKLESTFMDTPTVNLSAHDLVWLTKCWNVLNTPPNKIRQFSRWPRFGVPRIVRSGNLSLDRVMTEFFLHFDVTPACIKHVALADDDPASGLTFRLTKLKQELCFSRGKQKFTFDCIREPLDLVYQGIDVHMLKTYFNPDNSKVNQDSQPKCSQSVLSDGFSNDKCQDSGFFLSSDYFTIRKQAPKADPTRILDWQGGGRKIFDTMNARSEFENGSGSDDDGYNVVTADNCLRVSVCGLKILWSLQNRNAVWSWVGGISKAFQPPKPSPSCQYAQRKLLEEVQNPDVSEVPQEDSSNLPPVPSQEENPQTPTPIQTETQTSETKPTPAQTPIPTAKTESLSSGLTVKTASVDDKEEGTNHFMVNVIQPQFNLHSEEANGRFLLAAASGRVLARSFHSFIHVGYEVIEKALGTDGNKVPENEPEMTWKRAELSVMLEHVQAHVAPTDVDPGAGIQWLPKILRGSPKVKRTGALLERVFMPCQMYFRYTRHKGGLADLKVKPLKDLDFNSPNITASMTSRQFQVMLDVLSNLLFARLPKKGSLAYPTEDEDIEEEIDEVVPDGIEEVELAKIDLELKERERKLLLDDIRLILASDDSHDPCLSPEKDCDFWMVTGTQSKLVRGLKNELASIKTARKAASISLRMELQKAAQIHLMEKEKNKSPSCAMRVSMKINKVAWSMLADGESFSDVEINDMIYDFDRDYKDIGVAQFTTRSFEVQNLLPNAKSNVLLSSWNPPSEWGKDVMLRVDAKQGAPKDGTSPIEHLQVLIYPLKIHLTESMYRKIWTYIFPEEEQDSYKRQEVWKVSTTAGTRRGKKNASGTEATTSGNSLKENEAPAKFSATTAASSTTGSGQSSAHADASQASKKTRKVNAVSGSNPEIRRTSSLDKSWEENVAESVANEIVMQIHSSKNGQLNSGMSEETSKTKSKDSKSVKSGRVSQEEKKVSKAQDEKKSKAKKMMDFHNIRISQVELLLTYEGSRFVVSDLKLLVDTFHRIEFTGTWQRLFSRVKKHIIWGVLKSVTGMQGNKFKNKGKNHKEPVAVPTVLDIEGILSDNSDGGQPGKSDQLPVLFKRTNDGAGDGFVTSIKGLFSSHHRKAKAFVLRTMRGEEDDEIHADWSDGDADYSPFARQLTITKAKKLIRRHTKKFKSKGQNNSGVSQGSPTSSHGDSTSDQSDSSCSSLP